MSRVTQAFTSLLCFVSPATERSFEGSTWNNLGSRGTARGKTSSFCTVETPIKSVEAGKTGGGRGGWAKLGDTWHNIYEVSVIGQPGICSIFFYLWCTTTTRVCIRCCGVSVGGVGDFTVDMRSACQWGRESYDCGTEIFDKSV